MPSPTWVVGQVLTAADVNNWFVPISAYKTSATVRNTLSVTIDPDLQVTLAASSVYRVTFGAVYAAASGGLQTGWTIPASATGGYSMAHNLSGTGDGTFGYTWAATPQAGTIGAQTLALEVTGFIQTAGTGGTFGFNWASASGPASLTVGVGSILSVQRVG